MRQSCHKKAHLCGLLSKLASRRGADVKSSQNIQPLDIYPGYPAGTFSSI